MTSHSWLRWPAGLAPSTRGGPIAFGADYNPEQWSPEVWREDVRLMREAGVNIVNLGIFAWATVQPTPDRYEWDVLDKAFELLHANGVAVDLGTGTASPPPWLTSAHPEILPVTEDGRTLYPGGRQHWRPTSPVFRQYALAHVRAVAERYGDHPGLALWHVSNELGCHNAYDYSDDAALAFREWLRARYGTLEALNAAWATSFWSQRYSDWSQILPPRTAASFRNPGQQLDFRRFSSDALRDYLRAEVAVLRDLTPQIPVTTNFMGMGQTKALDYARWRADVDVLSNDHYLTAADPDRYEELAFSAALMRGLARARPWFLMEQSTSAVNWQPVNPPKAPGQLARDSLTQLAFGADAISFFQWRQSTGGAEKFHSALVPHAGTDTRVWREVRELGAMLSQLAEVAGSTASPARVALLFDWEAWWAAELDSHPSDLFGYRAIVRDWFRAFVDAGFTVDVQPVADDLSGYSLVVAPGLYLVDDDTRRRIDDHVAAGGHFVTTFFSGIVDTTDRALLGGYPGAFRKLLGVHVEEFGPLLPGDEVPVEGGGSCSLWADVVDVLQPDVEVLLRYADAGGRTGAVAATRRPVGSGSASYVGARLDGASLRALATRLAAGAGVTPELAPDVAVHVLRRERHTRDARYVFLLNRGGEPREVPGEPGYDVLAGRQAGDVVELAPYGVAVLRLGSA
ncbi:MAG TPA: beta-galactosidase [Jatrophihabitans sp.]|nr:beta-galactosidase [Jatrophihabitans sp.]